MEDVLPRPTPEAQKDLLDRIAGASPEVPEEVASELAKEDLPW